MALPRTKQKRLLKLVENLLYARKSSNIPREQKCYDALRRFCTDSGIDFNEALQQSIDQLRKSVAAQMNGILPPQVTCKRSTSN